MKHTQKSPSALRVKISEKEGVPQINVPISLLDAHGHLLDLSLHLVGAATSELRAESLSHRFLTTHCVS